MRGIGDTDSSDPSGDSRVSDESGNETGDQEALPRVEEIKDPAEISRLLQDYNPADYTEGLAREDYVCLTSRSCSVP